MSVLQHPLPRAEFTGFQDSSIPPSVAEIANAASHTPLIFGFTEKYNPKPMFGNGAALQQRFGKKTFDLTSKYATHATVLANTMDTYGNTYLFVPVRPDDAGPNATLALSLDLLPTKIPQYQRNLDGSYLYNQQGDRVPSLDGDDNPIVEDGYLGKWVIETIPQVNAAGDVITAGMIAAAASDPLIDIVPVANKLRNRTPSIGDQIDTSGSVPVESTRYPIWDAEINYGGASGNLSGLRMYAATDRTSVPVNRTVAEDQLTAIYRLQVLTRPSENVSPVLEETVKGTPWVEFSLKPDSINSFTARDLFLDKVYDSSYSQKIPGREEVEPTFGTVHTYHDYVGTVLDLLQAAEAAVNPEQSGDPEHRYEINLMNAQDLNGNTYHTFNVLGAIAGGINMNENAVHYARGGTDGTLSPEAFDAAVQRFMATPSTTEIPLASMPLYPFTAHWDTGYSFDTKVALMDLMSIRPDVFCFTSVHVDGMDALGQVDETAMGIRLQSEIRLHTESTLFGTGACRGAIIGQSGKLITSPWTKRISCAIQWAAWIARFMGRGDGKWVTGVGFDEYPNNIVDLMYDVSLPYKNDTSGKNDWDAGINSFISADRDVLFAPAAQTVYHSNASIFKSIINVLGACQVTRICFQSWVRLAGNSRLTNGQIIERSDRYIFEASEDRFEGRFIIDPNTYYTAEDEALGFPYHCRVDFGAPNMKTVGIFTINGRRISDMLASQ